jgi:ATP adenylyltransferase
VAEQRLWAPWRREYVATSGAPSDACIFCHALDAGNDRQSLIVHRGTLAFLILNAYPYASGHLMAVPARHMAGLEDARPDELAEIMILVRRAVVALGAAYRPDGFNVGLNQGRGAGAGILGHLHVHVVPRWHGDTNFITVLADTRVLPEAIEATYDRLVAALRDEAAPDVPASSP